MVNKKLVSFIENLEGCMLKAYFDVANYLTIGIGHWISPEDKKRGYILAEDKDGIYYLNLELAIKKGITKEEAYNILDYELNLYEREVPKLVKVKLNDSQLISLISFSFNVGLGAFRKSTLLRLLNQGDYNAPVIELPKWRKAGGKIIQGLVNRREKEVKMWKGLYV